MINLTKSSHFCPPNPPLVGELIPWFLGFECVSHIPMLKPEPTMRLLRGGGVYGSASLMESGSSQEWIRWKQGSSLQEQKFLSASRMPAARCTLSAAVTQQALLPDASSMFFTPSSRLLMFIKDSGYSILFSPRKWIETMLCSHFPEIPGSLRGLALPGGLEAGTGSDSTDRALQGEHFSLFLISFQMRSIRDP